MQNKGRLKFLYLDGIRGICATIIALYHAMHFSGYTYQFKELKGILHVYSTALSLGHFAISFFIVLSGFSLMIPIARSENGALNGGAFSFFKRRALRILPSYYAALCLFILLIMQVEILRTPSGTAWDSKIPFDESAILSHLFLIHNLSKEWFLKIDGPMWSVATEWQIYFTFPLLVGIWKKFGTPICVAAALLIGALPIILMSDEQNLSWAHPWYLGLFAFGMTSAIVVFSNDPKVARFREEINWSLAGGVATVLLPLFLILSNLVVNLPLMLSEMFTGFLFAIILVNFTIVEMNGSTKPLLLKLCSTKVAVVLGTFSYSVYLVHSPILSLLNLATLNVAMSIETRFIFMQIVGTAIAISVSYLFYLLVERAFQSILVASPAKKSITPSRSRE